MEGAVLVCAYILDLIIGDPRFIPHPVRGIGWAIEKTEHALRNRINYSVKTTGDRMDNLKREEKKAGTFLAVTIAGLTYIVFSIINALLMQSHLSTWGSYVSFAVLIYLVSTTIATRDLLKSVRSVREAVKNERIDDARKELGMIVGRDTHSLGNKGILKAAVETLAENTSDGIIAPLFYFAIGGLPLAMTYKAINTLDSMVGYRSDTYKHFGWASAKLDDIANYVPARITGVFIVGTTYILNMFRYCVHEGSERVTKRESRLGIFTAKFLNKVKERTEEANFEDSHRAFEIMKRDGRKHTSPNSGIPEAAMAGAVGVQLGGPSTYGSRVVEKPYIGKEFQYREHGERDKDTLYLSSLKEAIFITRIVSFLGLLSSLVIISMRTVLWG